MGQVTIAAHAPAQMDQIVNGSLPLAVTRILMPSILFAFVKMDTQALDVMNVHLGFMVTLMRPEGIVRGVNATTTSM